MSKYKAIRTTVNGITYDSKKEAEYGGKLDLLLRTGKIKDLNRQVRFCWSEIHFANDEQIEFKRKYIADFVYHDIKLNKIFIVDVKGFKTAEYKKKKKIVEKLFGIKITEI